MNLQGESKFKTSTDCTSILLLMADINHVKPHQEFLARLIMKCGLWMDFKFKYLRHTDLKYNKPQY